jgi:hypothetical protein
MIGLAFEDVSDAFVLKVAKIAERTPLFIRSAAGGVLPGR